MIADDYGQALHRRIEIGEVLAELLQQCVEAGLLDEEEQFFLAAEVVVEARETDFGGRGNIAHARPVVTLLCEHL